MIYSNPEFFILFALTLVLYLLAPGRRSRFSVLLAASFAFYAWSGALDTIVFASVILVSWSATVLGARFERHKKIFLNLGVVIMLAHLMFWKYAPWLVGEVQGFAPAFLSKQKLVLPLPVGISFFTLQGIAYLIDFRRGEAPLMTLPTYALFKSFFPQLVAGPIVRVNQILGQLKELRRPASVDIAEGLGLFTLGFLKKLAIADRVSPYVDVVFRDPSHFDRLSLAKALLAYSVQIWADFSGYTDMGRGAAKMLGFALPENFRAPYFARTPSDFWKRWHITLSLWIRDYLYIPLGGNRGGAIRATFVLVTTMALSGLWHGANWTFLLWGLYHGVLLATERGVRKSGFGRALDHNFPRGAIRELCLIGGTYSATLGGWLLFRATSFSNFRAFVFALIKGRGAEALLDGTNSVYFGILACFGLHCLSVLWPGLQNGVARLKPSPIFTRFAGFTVGVALATVIVGSVVMRSSRISNAFIYFQF